MSQMDQDEVRLLEDTLQWANENQGAVNSARSRVDLSGGPLPDVLARDPHKLVELLEAVNAEAKERGAPDRILEGIALPLPRMRAGLEHLDNVSYAHSVLRELEGSRSDFEVAPRLEEAIENAPDEANRRVLRDMAAVAKGPKTPEDMLASTDDQVGTAGLDCANCCVASCVVCGMTVAGCAVCCVIGCLVCGAAN